MKKSWNEYFMNLALNVATHNTCNRVFIGCVLVNSNDRIVPAGYNDAISGNPHCNEVGHTLRGGHCIVTIHMEMSVLLYCAKEGIAVRSCIRYVTHFPCLDYTKSLVQAGISRIYYHKAYRIDGYATELLDRNNVEYIQI